MPDSSRLCVETVGVKMACSYLKGAGAELLAPRQLGFGIKGGAEAAVRAARRYIDKMEDGKVFVKIDFKNAFNTLRRSGVQIFSRTFAIRIVLNRMCIRSAVQ